MVRTFLPVSVTAILLAACSPAAYKVNPPPVAVEESSPVTIPEVTSSTTWRDELDEPVVEEEPEIVKDVPESQKVGYLRIIGNLRWDQLTSKAEWMEKFPECLSDQWWNAKNELVIFSSNLSSNMPIIPRPDQGRDMEFKKCIDFLVGGIPLSPFDVFFRSNSGTDSKTMTSKVFFSFFDDSQSRAVKAALAQKYNFTTDGHCSQYTCWDLGDVNKSGYIEATPTPYSVSLLDQVQLDTSDL